jgi:hypothetical protein
MIITFILFIYPAQSVYYIKVSFFLVIFGQDLPGKTCTLLDLMHFHVYTLQELLLPNFHLNSEYFCSIQWQWLQECT